MITLHLAVALAGVVSLQVYRVNFSPTAIACSESESVKTVATVLRNGLPINARAGFFTKNATRASITRTGDRTATVKCRTRGTTFVGAGYKGKRDSSLTTVRTCAFATFAIVPDAADLANVGDTVTATASMLNDCSQLDTTTVMTWVSRAPAVASVTTTGNRQARITAVTPGFTHIAGLLGAFKDSVAVCVDSALTVTVTPATLTLDPAATGNLVANVSQCGASVAGLVSWATRSAPIATVASSGSQTATVTGVAEGGTFVVATRLTKTDSSAITVNAVVAGCTSTSTHMCPGDNVSVKVAALSSGAGVTFGPGTFWLGAIVIPKANMTFTGAPYVGGQPTTVLDGGRLLTGWTASGGRWYVTDQTQGGTSPGGGACDTGFERCHYPEQLWMDGVLKRHEDALADCGAGEWYFEYADGVDRIYVCDDPTGKTVITSVVATAIASANTGVTLKRLKVQHYAVLDQGDGAIEARGSNWTMDSLLVRDNGQACLRIEVGSNIALRRSRLSNCAVWGLSVAKGAGGPAWISSPFLYEVTVDSNCTSGLNVGFGCGAMKISNATGLIFRKGNVHRNKGNGIWEDVNNLNNLYDSNTVALNAGSGIFCEISDGCKVRYSTVTGNGTNPEGFANGAGIIISASPNADVSHNTLSGNALGIVLLQQNRVGGNGCAAGNPCRVENVSVDSNTVTQSTGKLGYMGLFEPTEFHTLRNNTFECNDYALSGSAAFQFETTDRTDAQWVAAGHDNGACASGLPR